MTQRLWRLNPRASDYASLAGQLVLDASGADADNELAADLFFGPDATPNFAGAFAIAGSSAVAFASQFLAGPPPGILPTDWFRRDDVQRVVIAEMDYQDQSGSGASATATTATLYLANWPYFDDENGRAYADCIKSVPRYNRAIDRGTLRGRYTSSIGSLELDNDGAFDYLLTKACDGSAIRFYIGDAGDPMQGKLPWARSQFIFLFAAVVVAVTAPSSDRISIALKDTNLLLNRTVGGDVTVGGSGPNANKFLPYNFGYLRQVEGILKDASALTYAFDRAGANLTFVDVRDKGVSVGYTDNGDGTVSLLAPPAGTVTADFYVTRGTSDVTSRGLTGTLIATRISDAMQVLVGVGAGLAAAGQYAGASPNFELQFTNDYHIGFSLPAPTNLVDLLDQICASGNIYWAIRRDGYFTYGWIVPAELDWFLAGNFPPMSSSATIAKDDLFAAPRITRGDVGPYEVQAYGNVNQLAQSDFASSLTPTQLAQYQRQGYFPDSYTGGDPGATAYLGTDHVLGDFYGLFQGGAPQNYHLTMPRELGVRTLISCMSDADADVHLSDFAAVRRAQRLPWLEFIDFPVDLSFYQLEPGNIVTFAADFDRFELAGVAAQVVSIDIAPTEGTIALGLARRRPAFSTEYVA